LPVWKRLPGDHVRVTRIAARAGRSLIGREMSADDIVGVVQAFGIGSISGPSAAELAELVLATGKPQPLASHDALIVKRSLVGRQQRIELTGFAAGRLDWYKAKGCFTEIIRYRTRLFVPVDQASAVLEAIAA